jgi:DNA-binding beta-propeller fold protein YncE
LAGPVAQAAEPMPLQLEAKIPLGQVAGRIDHMAVDLARRRLFVAELGNNTIGIVDLDSQKVVHVIDGLKEPQGVAYVAANDSLYVANAGDGSVRRFGGKDYNDVGRIELGDDADNIRVDAAANQIVVGYGSGALARLDAATGAKLSDIRLKAHPESFQLDPTSPRIFVNVPDAKEIAVVDRSSGRQTASWTMRDGANFPMALDPEGQRVIAIFRRPSVLAVFSMADGAVVARVPTCGDADDVFLDAARRRVYVSCGDGLIDVFAVSGASYERIAQVPTVSGARTSLFVPELDRLFIAARATTGQPASILVFKPEQSVPK